MLQGIPNSTACFIDANIFAYHLAVSQTHVSLSNECSLFFKRIRRGEISGVTSAAALAEAIHKIMMADAIAVHGLPPKGLPHYLASHPHLLASLSKHRNVLRLVQTLNLHVEPVTRDILQRAADISVQQQLLTNDAIIIAVMEKLGLTHLATNDDDFDSIPGITVWKPR